MALPKGRLAGIALVSAAVLLLQLVQTRIFSVMLWYHLTYLVVTFTMLGFAGGGALLACRPKWMEGDTSRRLALLSTLFAGSIILAYVLVTRTAAGADPGQHSSEGILSAALDYAVLVLPSLLAGLVVALVLGDARGNVGKLYGVNMVGSALGCLVYIPALRSLGGEGTVVACAGIGLLGGACFAAGSDRGRAWARGLSISAGVVVVLAVVQSTLFFEVPMAPYKTMSAKLRSDPDLQVEMTLWDPVCRLDVVGSKSDPMDTKWVYQDGDAITILPMGPAHERAEITDKEGLAYFMSLDPYQRGVAQKAPKVLAIGIGGGIDVLQATASSRPLPEGELVDFTGVEINHTTHGLMTDEFAEATANRYHLPGVTIHKDEGRSWLRRSQDKYDIIQMTGTDTYAALASGSYVMAESYLYTAEAYDDYLSHLTDDGVIGVVRFRFDPPRECLRLAAIAVDALRRDGAERPQDHIIITAWHGEGMDDDGNVVNLDYGHLLIAKQPLPPERVQMFVDYVSVPAYRASLLYAPGVETTGPTADYFAAVGEGTDAAFRESYPYNLDPVDDDNPFFFRFHRWRDLWVEWFGEEEQAKDSAGYYADLVGARPIGLMILGTVLGESFILVALLVLAPLLLFRREGLKVDGAWRWITYFAGLGAGYMLVEIVAMQRFVLYLGHPGYAMTVVLITFLTFSGLGAHVAGGSNDPARTLRRALAGVLLMLVILGVGLPWFFDATLRLPWAARVALTGVALGPVAFLMGMPFPSGLSLLARKHAGMVPWAFGVNGGASVLASIGAILIALGSGFSAAFLVAGVMYALAWLAGRRAIG
jgi:hypothetical protein